MAPRLLVRLLVRKVGPAVLLETIIIVRIQRQRLALVGVLQALAAHRLAAALQASMVMELLQGLVTLVMEVQLVTGVLSMTPLTVVAAAGPITELAVYMVVAAVEIVWPELSA